MARFGTTGPIEIQGLEHSVANLSWGVLRGALGPSDGTAGAASNVPSALGVLRHAEIYRGVPQEIDEAFDVLQQHVMRDGRLYPVAVATLPFLFEVIRRDSPIATRVADLIARYASAASTVDAPVRDRMFTIISDHAGDIVRWFGKHDRAFAALAIHVRQLREIYSAAVEGAERVPPEALLAYVELDDPPAETQWLALAMLDAEDPMSRMCAAAFLARHGERSPQLATRIDAELPPSAPAELRDFVNGLWTPTVVRPTVAPKLLDAEVTFTGKKLVIVKAGPHNVTLPWEGATLERGDRLQVGLTAHGQPKLAVLTDRKGNVRVIDFSARV
jgi:hypothetical protein